METGYTLGIPRTPALASLCRASVYQRPPAMASGVGLGVAAAAAAAAGLWAMRGSKVKDVRDQAGRHMGSQHITGRVRPHREATTAAHRAAGEPTEQ